MADHPVTASAGEPPVDFGQLYQFHQVFQKEIDIINTRRRAATAAGARAAEAPDIELEEEGRDVTGQPIPTPKQGSNVVGLALSGGGIRSAAFCLGVLQALEAAKALQRVDYLSTVSGGGYIGCSLTACLEQSGSQGWDFPYASRLKEDEPPALQHIRDYSNYLFPRSSALLHNASIYARGLAVNVLLIAPFLLGASAVTLLLYWLWSKFPNLDLGRFVNPFGLPHFFLTLDLAVILIFICIAWGIYRSVKQRYSETEIPGGWAIRAVDGFVVVLFIAAFCELQPLLIESMIEQRSGNLFFVMPIWIKTVTVALTPIAAAILDLTDPNCRYTLGSLKGRR